MRQILLCVFYFIVVGCFGNNSTLSNSEPEVKVNCISYDSFYNLVKHDSLREVAENGEIYIYGTTLLIRKESSGIHIYDNVDSSLLRPVGFLSLSGRVDVAVHGGVVYFDDYVDRIAVDLKTGNLSVTRSKGETDKQNGYRSIDGWGYFNYRETEVKCL